MSEAIVLSVSEIEHLVMSALVVRGAYPKSVASLARAVAAAEGHGISSHGLAYLPTYREQLACDRVDPNAIPIRRGAAPGVAVVDAADGFAHPAKDLGLAALCPLAHKQGGAALAIDNSYNCGVLGYYTERIAERKLVGLVFTNARHP